jgi:glycosyltransferase involved in cell wall biosynthesis
MHILYIHQYFTTPLGSTGTRSYEFARRWVAKGHKVTMLTSTTNLTSEDLAQANGWFFKKFTVDGINVLALNIPYRQQMGVFKRCMSFLAFLMLSSFIVLVISKVDVIYATSTPLTIGIPALAAKWFRRKKFVFEVRDQWPESVVEAGVIKNRFFIKILLWLERTIYKNASEIIAVSDGMAEGVRQVAGEKKPIHVVPNCANLDLFRPDIDGSAIRQIKNWGDKLVFLQAGSMGKAHNLDFVIDAAEKLKEHRDIVFVLIGEGSQKPELEKKVQKLGLTNVEILPSVSKQQLPEFFAATDVCLVIIGLKIMEKHASLNKFYDGLSSGKPMLLNYYGWQGKLIEDNNAGYGCKFRDLDQFVERILYIKTNRNQLAAMGRNARLIAETRFDSNKLAAQALIVLETISNRSA